MARTYRSLPIPKDLPKETREYLENMDRYLSSLSPQDLGDSEITVVPAVATQATTSGPTLIKVPGDLENLPVGAPGAFLALRFASYRTVVATPQLRIRAPFTPASDEDILLLLSDGSKWLEVARTETGTTSIACPVRILQESQSCYPTPIFAIFPWDATSYDVADEQWIWAINYYSSANYGTISQKADIEPWQDPLAPPGATPLFYLGYLNPWKGVSAWGVSARYVMLERVNAAIAAGTVHDWDPTGGTFDGRATIYRVTPAGPGVTDLTSIKPWALGVYGPVIDFINVGSVDINIRNEDDPLVAGSTAIYRVITGLPGTPPDNAHVVGPNDAARMWYDSSSDRWRILK